MACVLLGAACAWTAVGGSSAQADEWPRFRGPNGTGISELTGVPTEWTEDDYEWVIELPGLGHSSPVVWGEALFLTTGHEDGGRRLHRIDAVSGEIVWSQESDLAPDHLHQKNSHASCTPALDGERVYVAFANDEHYLALAYTMDGDLAWSTDLGTFESQHGQGVSPIVYDELVIVPNDQMGPSAIVALDRETGDVVWTAERTQRRTSYATPFILERADGSPELICLSGATGLAGLDPHTGEQRWATGELPLRTVASPVYGNGLLIASCGGGGIGKYMIAVDPPDEPGETEPEIRYDRPESAGLPYVPTPVVQGEHVYLWCDRAMVCCVEMAGGETVWRRRVPGNYSGSPVLIDGRLYCISEEGEIVVVAAAPEFHMYGSSPLGDGSHATPAVANGRVYFRGFSRLACLASRATSTAAQGGRTVGGE